LLNVVKKQEAIIKSSKEKRGGRAPEGQEAIEACARKGEANGSQG
jgi:hypothetical protein